MDRFGHFAVPRCTRKIVPFDKRFVKALPSHQKHRLECWKMQVVSRAMEMLILKRLGHVLAPEPVDGFPIAGHC